MTNGQTADVVIVGAGIMGLSIAYQVTRRSPLRVLVLEKAENVAEGSTGASAAIIRARYSNPEVSELARDGIAAYRNWAEFTGISRPRCEFVATGIVWMMDHTAESAGLEADRLTGLGISATVLSADGLRRRFPALSACMEPFDPVGDEDHTCREHDVFLHEDDAGYADPVGATQDLLEAARREGVEVRFHSEVVDVITQGGRVAGVVLAGGTRVDAPTLINASGPWCNRLNKLAGLDLPWRLTPTRIQMLHRPWPDEVPRPLPIVIDGTTGLYLRPESRDQVILFGSVRREDEQEEIDDPDDFNRNADRSFRDRLVYLLHHRLPDLPHRGETTGVAGLYTVNKEDVHPLLGPTEIDGFYLANGFSGHGFKLAPMVGSLLAQELTGEKADFDTGAPISFFAVDRKPISVHEKSVLA